MAIQPGRIVLRVEREGNGKSGHRRTRGLRRSRLIKIATQHQAASLVAVLEARERVQACASVPSSGIAGHHYLHYYGAQRPAWLLHQAQPQTALGLAAVTRMINRLGGAIRMERICPRSLYHHGLVELYHNAEKKTIGCLNRFPIMQPPRPIIPLTGPR